MTTGALLYPAGYTFLDDNGVPLNAGLLYSYRTGTTTAQNVYSDSTLLTALSNPVVLNSAGRATTNGTTLTAIYGDPSSGFDYRLTLKTSALVQVFQLDDIVVDGADTVTLAAGSFTGTLTGYASGPTGTITYRIFSNSSGTGRLCLLYAASAITGESNANTLTMTGLPAACTPTVAVLSPVVIADNAVSVQGAAQISASGTSVTFSCDTPLSTTGFTTSGTKGLSAGWSLLYQL